MAFGALQAGMVAYRAHGGDQTDAYYAHPSEPGKCPGVVVIHHFPGWDEWTTEVCRKFAHHGYAAVAPNLYVRLGDGADPAIVARARAEGGMPDEQVVGDIRASMIWLRAQPNCSGKIGVIGFCSGGRHAYLSACRITEVDAVVNCWGGNVVVNDKSALTDRQPTAPIDLTASLRCPVLGLFGNEDSNPSPQDVDRLEAELKRLGKTYEFHRYAGAGHAFNAWYRPNYRQEQAQDAWAKTFAFYARYLGA